MKKGKITQFFGVLGSGIAQICIDNNQIIPCEVNPTAHALEAMFGDVIVDGFMINTEAFIGAEVGYELDEAGMLAALFHPDEVEEEPAGVLTGVTNDIPDWAFDEEGIDPDWLDHCKECHEEYHDHCYDPDAPTEYLGSWKIIWNEKKHYHQLEPNPEGHEGYSAIWRKEHGNILQVVWSKTTKKVHSLCSPCYPGQADLDSGPGEIEAYCLPEEV